MATTATTTSYSVTPFGHVCESAHFFDGEGENFVLVDPSEEECAIYGCTLCEQNIRELVGDYITRKCTCVEVYDALSCYPEVRESRLDKIHLYHKEGKAHCKSCNADYHACSCMFDESLVDHIEEKASGSSILHEQIKFIEDFY